MNIERDAPLMSRGMIAVIVAQFFLAFGDNALLFATLAVLKSRLEPAGVADAPTFCWHRLSGR